MRGRRLSEAARVLANGGPDILSVALDFGYGSHEAFTRAFRDQFGLTPESVRAQRHLDNFVGPRAEMGRSIDPPQNVGPSNPVARAESALGARPRHRRLIDADTVDYADFKAR
jgi:AraC-like DNA-binding protein